MKDQAEVLRRRVQQEKLKQTLKIISVVSGKGGVGKSNFSLNFAIELVKTGKRVLIVDMDIGMANIEILMGGQSSLSLVDLFEMKLSIDQVICHGLGGVDFIPGGNGIGELFQLTDDQFEHLLQEMTTLAEKYDILIFDMGAGISEESLNFILSTTEVIAITTPEPTSIADAYAAMKVIYFHDRAMRIRLIINRVSSHKQGETAGKRLQNVAAKFLQKEIQILGMIPDDPSVQKAVCEQKPFLLAYPHSKASVAIAEIVQTYLNERLMLKKSRPMDDFIQKLKRFFKER